VCGCDGFLTHGPGFTGASNDRDQVFIHLDQNITVLVANARETMTAASLATARSPSWLKKSLEVVPER
jgi:hypothetical protein